jgi:hypothetical protein
MVCERRVNVKCVSAHDVAHYRVASKKRFNRCACHICICTRAHARARGRGVWVSSARLSVLCMVPTALLRSLAACIVCKTCAYVRTVK